MAGLSESHASADALSPNKSAAIARLASPLARDLTRAPAGPRVHSPKELSSLLLDAGVVLSACTIRARCNLPAGDPFRIHTLPHYPGRYYIPDSERVRLLSMEASA